MLRIALVACAAAAAFSVPAQAVTYTTAGAVVDGTGHNVDPGLGLGEVLVTGFDGHDTLSYDPAQSSGFGLYTGSYSGVAAAPAGDISQYMAISTGGSVLFDLRSLGSIHSASVYLGSIDTYNFIDVIGRDGAGNLDFSRSLLTISGSDMPPSNGDWYDAQTNRRLTLNFDASDNVGALVFRSNGVAFEFDSLGVASGRDVPGDHSTAAVPEPASWAMMVGGFGLVGGAMRSRRSKLSFARS
jgi:hypothetical protein